MHLFPHQQELLNKNPDRHLLAHGTGTGKSLMAIRLAEKREGDILVICPKMLKEKWMRDCGAYGLVYSVLSKEEFKKFEPTLGKFETVIVDEAHTFFGITSQLHKSLMRYFKRYDTPYRYLLTATPYLSTPWNIYAAGILLGLPLNYQKFRNTFFHEIRMGHRFIWKAKEDAHSKALLKQIIDKIGTSIQLSDVFDVPDQAHNEVFLELDALQQQMIKDNYDPVAIVQWTAQHRIENTKGQKLQWLKDFATVHKKFVVFVRYLEQLEEIKRGLRGKYIVLEMHGGVANRDEIVKNANELKEVILLVQASCSEGYELPTFDTAVYASMSFSYKDLVQSQGRLLRANALHQNNYHYLIIGDGVDEEVWKALKNKQDFSFELLSTQQNVASKSKV